MINIRINNMININIIITFTLSLPSISNTFHVKDTFVQINEGFSEILIMS